MTLGNDLDASGSSAASGDPLDDWLHRVANGDRAAFAEVFQRTSPKLLGLCIRILPTRQEAEDALQEAFLTIWRRADRFDRTRGGAWPWLVTLTRHCAIDRLRASPHRPQAPVEEAAQLVDPRPLATDLLLHREREQRLHDCLEQLEPRDLHLIRTAFLEGTSYPELSRRLAAPLGTVKSRIRRTLRRLRDCL